MSKRLKNSGVWNFGQDTRLDPFDFFHSVGKIQDLTPFSLVFFEAIYDVFSVTGDSGRKVMWLNKSVHRYEVNFP